MSQELVRTGNGYLTTLADLERMGVLVIDENQIGLILPPGLSYDQYEAIGRGLWKVQDWIQFLIGDWLNYGENEYGDDIYAQAADMTGAATQTLRNWKSVAKKVPPQRRRPGLDYTHHVEVATLNGNDQRKVLKEAQDQGLNKLQVRARVDEIKGRPVLSDHPTVCPECHRPF